MESLSLGSSARQDAAVLQSHRWSVVRAAGRIWRAHRFVAVLGAEIALAAISYSLAVVMLADGRGGDWAARVLGDTLGLLLVFRITGLASVRLYRRSLRYANLADLLSIAKAVSLTSIVFGAFAWWQFPALKIPAAVFLMDWTLLLILWGGLHFGVRILKAQRAVGRRAGKRVVIVGAGDAGLTLLRELALDSTSPCRPVALVDDDPGKAGRTIYGVPVEGGTCELARIAAEKGVDEILICIPSATRPQMRQILSACRETGIPVRTLPTLAELMNGKVTRRDLRQPGVEDLLQREEIRVDAQATRALVSGKVVLVTGAGGSIGSELCRQIAEAGPRKLLLLDKSENSLFYVHMAVAERMDAGRTKPLLVDLLYRDRVREILLEERPEIIFHAAAHKHVGLLELHPQEAIRNNVLGTRNLAEAALETGVARFVNISTDKAVQPRNYMGLSKKMTELCIQDLARQQRTRFSNVRFGNVAGSTGSVLRLFWDQIQRGGPIRVSDPRATRYFMSVREAVHLILRAAMLGAGGETFVFDMGEPLNIYELAKTMTLFAGLKPERDLSIEFTGLKEGEKITEELWEEWEAPSRTAIDRILVIAKSNPSAVGVVAKIARLEELLAQDDRAGLLEYVREIVPDFSGGHPVAARRVTSLAVRVPPPLLPVGSAGAAAIASREVA
ncbi:MAG: nucleoside-diphosphate sugar epimerase/dehydratase [Candidatus Acidiferrales bacterium]